MEVLVRGYLPYPFPMLTSPSRVIFDSFLNAAFRVAAGAASFPFPSRLALGLLVGMEVVLEILCNEIFAGRGKSCSYGH